MIELSVIIPVHESYCTVKEYLPGIVNSKSDSTQLQFIVVDSGVNEDTMELCKSLRVEYHISGKARRSIQMNKGADYARASCFFFVHIDSILPKDFDLFIRGAIQNGAESGCFRMQFSPTTRFLSFFAYFTRFHWRVSRGGDQGLFVLKSTFQEAGRFRTDWEIMEDIEICRKLEKRGTFSILKGPITTSSRKYQYYGQWRLQLLFGAITILFWLGVSVSRLTRIYKFFVSKK